MRLLVNAGDRAFILVRIPGYIRATSMQEYKNLFNNQKVKRKQQQTPRLAAVLSFILSVNR
jgi:hypothetical protein